MKEGVINRDGRHIPGNTVIRNLVELALRASWPPLGRATEASG